jgi:hypothetical protein
MLYFPEKAIAANLKRKLHITESITTKPRTQVMAHDVVVDQCDTVLATAEEIMRDPSFRRGFADYRRGRKPNFDNVSNRWKWRYEWGRQFAAVAPRDMIIVLPRAKRLNPKAVELFESSMFFKDICP